MNNQFLLPLQSLAACMLSSSIMRHGTPKLLRGEPKKFLCFFLRLLMGHRSTRLLFAPWRGKCVHVATIRNLFLGWAIFSCLHCRLHSTQCVDVSSYLNAKTPQNLLCYTAPVHFQPKLLYLEGSSHAPSTLQTCG